MWSFFLASSTIVSRQGGASVYQLTLHKNTNGFDRSLGVKSHVGLRFADDKAWKCVDPSSRRAPFLLQEADPPFQTLTLPPPPSAGSSSRRPFVSKVKMEGKRAWEKKEEGTRPDRNGSRRAGPAQERLLCPLLCRPDQWLGSCFDSRRRTCVLRACKRGRGGQLQGIGYNAGGTRTQRGEEGKVV